MENIIFGLAMTAHLGLSGDFNEVHPHARYEHDNSFISGVYLNSMDNVSLYAGKRFEYNDFGFEATIVTGYGRLFVPQVRGTYNTSDNTLIFVSPGAENLRGNFETGFVLGFEILNK
jgi:hypothetical protein